MIEIRNVSKTFYMKDSEIHAVDDVSLKIASLVKVNATPVLH